ncbi:hypothetical protein [Rhodoferax sp. PAMC 29310]|uniref:hypothetical protein n=1 Tax=Rhodoferax sp. PAMC 29310 TaxID=2822760 RepID=UPI001B32BC4F|nr:hypothetical protein [Rhodoferax sp. PAMC 29310]
MNNSFNLSVSATRHTNHSVRPQRVLATTLADWGRPLPGNIDLDDHDTPRARRCCSLLSRTTRPASTRFHL